MKEYILSQDGETLKLPVNPQSFSDEQSHNNPRFQTYALGEIKANGKRNLREIVIESFFPKRYQSFCTYKEFPSPYECKAIIEKWKESGKPIRLLITETNINFAYTIDKFICLEKDGTGDLYFQLELSEYRFLNVPVSHNPAPIQKTTGLRERPKVKGKGNDVKKKVRVKQAKKRKKQKESSPKPNKTAIQFDAFKIESDNLKRQLNRHLATQAKNRQNLNEIRDKINHFGRGSSGGGSR
ncbi:MAG: hypothetical protein Q4D65_08045 [Peptostreptococcaceae bacterium]|nr:hypothetical protein [Peptostreptococcaceae bacterium]